MTDVTDVTGVKDGATFFHGTSAGRISRLQPSECGLFGCGIYLSSCPLDAAQYGEHLAEVSFSVQRPFFTKADYAAAEIFDCDTPAGPMILEALGQEQAAAFFESLRQNKDGYLGKDWTHLLQSMGHDSICVRWEDGLEHWIVFDDEQVTIDRWIEDGDSPIGDSR